ncbi:hypothetical protein [Pseudoalteromonas sp. OOF1S-7]|uniref:hypothetical protein n=1 Tax=Pseudoalteromonas sp. OOF1S-7 TaxID=2917757 RepID=UPI001EF50102|nr:hypothetical protein [Pseudoalteromonas sp. OOF1S-7]MCG7535359.1 hypothetical protein [Pseudoalteromonas sp. OOF1S-7]
MKKRVLTFGMLAAFSIFQASAFTCSGKVYNVDVSPSGKLRATIGDLGEANYVCNLVRTSRGVEPDACKAMHSQLLSAMMAGKSVTLWFENGIYKSCEKHTWDDLQVRGLTLLRVDHK